MSTRRTNAERTQRTRSQLTATARQLFSEHGYSSTTIAQIARSSGVTTGALYHHWAGKEALLVDVVHDIHRELALRIQALDVEDEPVALLLRSGQAFLALCADPAVARLLLLDAPAVLGYERWRRIDERWWLSATIRLVERARPMNDLGPDPDPDPDGAASSRQLALALLGALTYLGHEVAIQGAAAVDGAGRTYGVLLTSLLR
ncbi:TetR/AcrR family transcriptional regulator [Streptomyces sp. H39-S7]|uniref:TetR/AcrR family transcriptional regulator n=1 Tax=Streptomyces sp. H39-S7 TaxID=3004357 RepID=UPI0022AEAC18|nr:TetR/AcrR family transcriptional regulator [Streptomyces sp. H39-S7]MCZ4123620.1 helix-turn-helix domain containing protein [Streptomyces sp. H39-S7]